MPEVPKPTITRENLLKKIAASGTFPSVPKVAAPIILMANDEKTSFNDLAKVIETDPELSARILKIANSGFYGFRREITSITHALVMLGWNAIKMIALGSTILTRMCAKDRTLFNHSMRVAQIARFIAIEANLYKVEEFAVVGLLHDFGVIILKTYFPDEYMKALQFSIDHGLPIYLGERELLGVDHADVGGWTLEEWDLPENITESVAKHHSYDPNNYHARKTAVIHVADVFAFAVDFKGPSWEKVPEVSAAALETLGFSNAELKDLVLTTMKTKFDPLIV